MNIWEWEATRSAKRRAELDARPHYEWSEVKAVRVLSHGVSS